MATYSCDVIVIGGGVIGCATLFELTRTGFKCFLAEKEDSLIAGASSANRLWLPFLWFVSLK